MPTLRLTEHYIVDIDGRPLEGGSLSQQHSVTVTGTVYDCVFSITASTATKLFDVDEDLADFDFLRIESDKDLILELVTDADNVTARAFFHVPLTGSGTTGEYGPAFILVGDAGKLGNGAYSLFTGTAGNIEEIWAYGAATTKCHILAIT